MRRHRKLAAAPFVLAIAACLLAAPSLADPASSTDVAPPTTTADGVTTGSINVEQTPQQRMADCMAIWEKRTHMSKQEWRRTCKSSLQDLPNL
jgi:hypothetical protein